MQGDEHMIGYPKQRVGPCGKTILVRRLVKIETTIQIEFEGVPCLQIGIRLKLIFLASLICMCAKLRG